MVGLWFGSVGQLAARSVWSIDHIQVDQINADPRTARELAIQAAEFKALPILLRRITLESDWNRLPSLSHDAMAAAVEGFEVNSERASAQRYTAQLTVSFYPEVIRSLLRNSGIPLVEPSNRPVLVLPVYSLPALDEAGALTLWDDRNPWRALWLKDAQNGILVPWLTAKIDDFGVNARSETIVAEPNGFFNKRLLKNDIGGIVLATVQRREDGLVVTAKLWTATNMLELGSTSLSPLPNESSDAQMRRALEFVTLKIDGRWKTTNQHDGNSQSRRGDMVFQIQSIAELVAVQKILDNVSQIRSRSLVALHRRAAQYQLDYVSDWSQLKLALMQRGFLFVTNDEVPILRLSSSPAPAPVPRPMTQPERLPNRTHRLIHRR